MGDGGRLVSSGKLVFKLPYRLRMGLVELAGGRLEFLLRLR